MGQAASAPREGAAVLLGGTGTIIETITQPFIQGTQRAKEVIVDRPLGISAPKQMTLIDYKVKGRSYGIIALAKYSFLFYKHAGPQVDLIEVTDFEPSKIKEEGLGSIPLLKHDKLMIIRHNAILRYVAHHANMLGETSEEYALSEMLIEEATELMNVINKADSSPTQSEKIKNYNYIFKHMEPNEGAIMKHLKVLEKLVPITADETKPFFFDIPKRLAGEFAIVAVLDIISSLEPTALSVVPRLERFHRHMTSMPCFDSIKEYPIQFHRV